MVLGSRSHTPPKIGGEDGVDARDVMILLTLSNYLVAKFSLLPPEKVLQILEHLTINGIEVPGFRNEPQGGNILGHFAQLVQCLSEQNFDAAFLSLRETLEAYTQLIETGNLPLATATMQGLAGWLVSQKFRVSDVANVIIATVMRGERNELPEFGHIGRVNLFGQTDGAFQEAAHWFVQHKRPPKKMQTSENAFSLVDQNERAVALSTVKTDGYYVFQNTVAPDLCRDLCQWARTAPAQAVFPYSGDTPMAPVDLNRDDVDGYNINLQSAMETPEVQRILCQSPLPSLAQDHLGCAPILANVAMRWVLPSDRENSNDLAQIKADCISLGITMFPKLIGAEPSPQGVWRGDMPGSPTLRFTLSTAQKM